MGLLISWVFNALALIVATYLVPGFHVSSFKVALLAALVVGLINIFIKPVLLILTAPINLLTLGLFTFVVNAVVLWLASLVVPGMVIDNLTSGILAAVVISLVSTIFAHILSDISKAK